MKSKIKYIMVPFIFILLIWGRTHYLERLHFDAAEGYYKESNYKLAIREYDASMHFYTPFSPYMEGSAQRLWRIGEAYEKEGRADLAVIAYSSLRSSLYASRSFFIPGGKWIKRCDEKIAALNVKIAGNGPGPAHLADRYPDALWSAVSVFGLLGWAASAIFMILRGMDKNGAIRRSNLLYGAASFGLMFLLWITALVKA